MKSYRLARGLIDIRLDQEIGRGGEGLVYGLHGHQDSVAKIYSLLPDDRKTQKLVRMAEAVTPALLRIAAWPTDVVIDENGRACGFTMPRITARRDIHELYSPKSRSAAFPEADFAFLIHVGTNIARAFAVVHEHGHVIGDVNHGNVLVGPDGTVKVIDCDSYQFCSGQDVFTCDVGVPLFTPPELHGQPFRGLGRQKNHDAFGLAVIIFHLLFMGRHPFAGRYLGNGDMPIEKAIVEYRFAYGPDRARRQMDSPPGTLSLESVGGRVAELFIRAFSRNGNSVTRPPATEWVGALDLLGKGLRKCDQASWHHFPRQLAACPWCRIENETGVRLFSSRLMPVGPSGTVDVAALWKSIEGVPAPGPTPPLPSDRPWSLPSGVEIRGVPLKGLRAAVSAGLVLMGFVSCGAAAASGGFVFALFLYGLAFAVWPRVAAEKIASANATLADAKAGWAVLLEKWQYQVRAPKDAFDTMFSSLRKSKSELEDLPLERQRRLTKIEKDRKADQLNRYLDRFRIDRSTIQGIGLARTAMLASYGVETSADIERSKVMGIPGFGEVLTLSLVTWRRAHEASFRFNPNEAADPRALAKMEQELGTIRETEAAKLRQGSTELRRLSQEIVVACARLLPLLEKAWSDFKIAESRRNAL